MERLEFLDRLSASINSVLPEGFRVEPNRRPDLEVLHEASQAESLERMNEIWKTMAPDSGGTGSVTIEHHRFGVGEPNPFARKFEDEPDVFFLAPPEARHGPSGSNVHGYFDEDSSSGEDTDLVSRLADAALWVLDGLQDSMCEGTREPWPNRGVAEVPSPRARIVDAELQLWFEDSHGTVLTLPGIALA